MKRLALSIPFFFLASFALAQTAVQTIPGDAGPIKFDMGGNATLSVKRMVNAGTAPALSACGGAGLAIVGNDFAGTVSVGATPTTTCTITFNNPYTSAPACNLTWPTGNLAAMSWTSSTTAIVVTQTSTASNTINYVCFTKQ
jgi:hypothetical protein